MAKQFVLSLLVVSVLALAGCETTKGLGEDIENTGENIQDGVKKNQ